MKVIVDTSLLIDFARKRKIDKEDLLWTSLVKYSKTGGHQLVVPPVVVFEFFSGEEMNKLENQKRAEEILKDTSLVNFDSEVAKEAAALLRNNKIKIGTIDYFIAATTISIGGELATLNPKHFEIFEDLKLFDFRKLDKA